MADPPSKIQPPIAPRPSQSGQILNPVPSQPTHPEAAPLAMARGPSNKHEDRILMLDGQQVKLLGFYEATPADENAHPGFTMQVNHAGLMLAGWISESPSVVTNVTPIKTLSTLRSSERIGFGVFKAQLSSVAKLKAGTYIIQFRWHTFESTKEKINVFDPIFQDGHVGLTHPGTLRLEYTQDPNYASLGVRAKSLGFQENKNWQITGINFEGKFQNGFDPVRLIRRKLRLPYDFIRQVEIAPSSTPPLDPERQNNVLREALIASHVCIIPESHILKILRTATKLFIYGPVEEEPDIPPMTEAALDEWLNAADDKLKRRIAREKVLSFLTSMHNDIAALPYAYHRETVRDLFTDNSKKTYKGEQTYYDLYVYILDEEIRDHPESAKNTLDPIIRWGTFPMASGNEESFRYTVTLSPSLALPKTLLPVNGGVATLDVKCERIQFEVDGQGRKKIDRVSGNPVVKKTIDVLYDTSKPSTVAKPLAVTLTGGIAPSSVPVAAELYTLIGDLKYEDFTEGTFSFVLIRGTPNVKIGPYAEIKELSTGFFNLTLKKKNGLELWGSFTQLLSVRQTLTERGENAIETLTTSPKSADDMLRKGRFIKPFAEDIYKKGAASAAEGWLDSLRLKNVKEQFKNIFGATVGVGKIFTLQAFRTLKVNKEVMPKPTFENTHTPADERIASFFRRNSADFSNIIQSTKNDNITNLLTARDLVEFFLAVNLELVMNPDATIELVGHASPEGPAGPLPAGIPDIYNFELSANRVDAVLGTILRAMKMFPETAWAQIRADYNGEVVAREPKPEGGGGLSDPPSTLNTVAFLQWLKSHQREVKEWPYWRRVDMRIGGVALLRLYD